MSEEFLPIGFDGLGGSATGLSIQDIVIIRVGCAEYSVETPGSHF